MGHHQYDADLGPLVQRRALSGACALRALAQPQAFVCALSKDGLLGPLVLDGPINGFAFAARVEQFLVPELRLGDIVVMDMLELSQGRGRQGVH